MTLTSMAVFAFAVGAGFSPREATVVTCIAQHESSFRPRVVNVNRDSSRDTGLMQINDWHVKAGRCAGLNLRDPGDNLKCARELYTLDNKNFGIWVAYKKNRTKCQTYDPKD